MKSVLRVWNPPCCRNTSPPNLVCAAGSAPAISCSQGKRITHFPTRRVGDPGLEPGKNTEPKPAVSTIPLVARVCRKIRTFDQQILSLFALPLAHAHIIKNPPIRAGCICSPKLDYTLHSPKRSCSQWELL